MKNYNQFITNEEVVMIRPVASITENEDQIPDGVKKFDEEDILSAEIVYESSRVRKINENKAKNHIFENEKILAKDLKQGDKIKYKGKSWSVAVHEGIDNSAILNCIDNDETTKVKGSQKFSKINESFAINELTSLEEEMKRWEIIDKSEFMQKFKQDWQDSDVWNKVCQLMVDYSMNPQEFVKKLKEVLTEYDMLSDYDGLINKSIFEYVNKGTYGDSDEEVEDLYYIQAGDLIYVNHKDYGNIECIVKKVDIKGNKVYFVTSEKGVMGCCGFNRITNIKLIDESTSNYVKENLLVETDWSDLNKLIEKHKTLGNIERTLNNSSIINSSKDFVEFAIYCPDNDKLDAFLTEYNFLKYGKIIDVVYVSTNHVILKSVKHDAVNEEAQCAIVEYSNSFRNSGVFKLTSTQVGDQFVNCYLALGCDDDNSIPHIINDMNSIEMSNLKKALDMCVDSDEAWELVNDEFQIVIM